MAETVAKRATYADLEAVPANLVAEILDGVLVTHPRPLPRHGVAQARLAGILDSDDSRSRLRAGGGWIFMSEPELHLGEHIVVPDMAAWRLSRMTEMPERVGITLVPDWICEILSPSTASDDRTVKFRIYHQFEVSHAWYLDPGYRTLEVFQWSAPHWVPLRNFGDFEQVTAAPFDAITFALGSLWPFDTSPADQQPGSGA